MSNVLHTKMNTPEAVERILREQNRLILVCATTIVTDLDATRVADQGAMDEIREDLKLHQAMGVMLNNTTKLLTMQNNPFNRGDGEPQE